MERNRFTEIALLHQVLEKYVAPLSGPWLRGTRLENRGETKTTRWPLQKLWVEWKPYINIWIYIYIISWGHSFLSGCSGLKHFWMTALWSAVSEASVARRYGPERQHASLGQMNWSLSLLNYIYITLVIYYPVATRFIYHDSPSLRLQDSVFETPRCHELINPRGPVQIQKSRLETSHRKVSPKPRSCKRGWFC